jgi:hypothetical protein
MFPRNVTFTLTKLPLSRLLEEAVVVVFSR